MRRFVLLTLFWGLFGYWVYQYPYQWWLKYGLVSDTQTVSVDNPKVTERDPKLPDPFWGASLETSEPKPDKVPQPKTETQSLTTDIASPVLDEIKLCFGEGPLTSLTTGNGDLGSLVMSLQNQLGPVQEDLLLEKNVTLSMKDSRSRTLVYEWISAEEGSDVYWHETDEEGFPRPIDLPEGSGQDMATFERLKSQGTPSKSSETRMIQLQNGLQLGVERVDEVVQSLSLKDEGHLAKCRRDAVKTFICDCLN